MSHSCTHCGSAFEITPEDLAFYDKVSPEIGGKKYALPLPTHCPECRQQRRVACANQLFLFKRTCDFTGEQIISNSPPESPHKVYRQDIWHSDKWDPLQYGRDFDFNRPFFDQWCELALAVPIPSLFTGYQYDENSEYTNHAGKNKNCYMIFDSDENRDCYYCYSLNGSRDCLECYRVRKSELCYGCIDSLSCYNSVFLQDCENCSDSFFLKNCLGCKHCLMSSNLRNKEYFVENKQVSPQEFQRIRAMLTARSRLQSAWQRFEKLKLEYPQKYIHGMHNENVRGDYLLHCKNADHCFDSENLWDCRYVFQGFMPLKDCMDIQECGDGERCYECAFAGYGSYHALFSTHVLGSVAEVLYCNHCPHSKHLFGCIGLMHKQYCIFNKQYTEEEYGKLVGRIIEHMMKTGEWGEFFPIKQSYVPYNLTLAQQYFPLTKEEAQRRGYWWRDADPKQSLPATIQVSDDIHDVSDAITNELLACTRCKKNYRIIPQELALYRKMQLPLPADCYDCRLAAQTALRNPRKLWMRNCQKCQKAIETTYAPDRPEKIYCEDCYLKEVY